MGTLVRNGLKIDKVTDFRNVSIFELAMRRCVLRNDTSRLFFIEAKQSTSNVVGVQHEKDLHTEPKKGCSAMLWLDMRTVPGLYKRFVFNLLLYLEILFSI